MLLPSVNVIATVAIMTDHLLPKSGMDNTSHKRNKEGEEHERIKLVVEEFTKTKTKAELLNAALERSLLIAPVTSTDEVTESEQLSARDYWRDIEHPSLGQTLRYPGPFAKFSATPVSYSHRPPSVGEHNHEIYADELGFSEQRLAELQVNGVI